MDASMSAVTYLQEKGLRRIAERLCEQEHLEKVADLGKLTDDRIDEILWLKPQQNKKLKHVCEEVRRYCNVGGWLASSRTSDMGALLEAWKALG